MQVGTQIRMQVTLEEGQLALFKPKWYVYFFTNRFYLPDDIEWYFALSSLKCDVVNSSNPVTAQNPLRHLHAALFKKETKRKFD